MKINQFLNLKPILEIKKELPFGNKEPLIPDYQYNPAGHIITVKEYLENVNANIFTNYDGHAYPIKNNKMARNIRLKPGKISDIPSDAEQIGWFNK